jgi:hypothetical protein
LLKDGVAVGRAFTPYDRWVRISIGLPDDASRKYTANTVGLSRSMATDIARCLVQDVGKESPRVPSGRRAGRLGMMRIRPVALSVCALFLMAAGGRAGAESFTYQGEIQIQSIPGDPCAATSSEANYTITVYSRDDSLMQRIDGYVEGDKIVAAHVTGNNLGQLGVAYPGESSPSHVMQLHQLGDGSFVRHLRDQVHGGCLERLPFHEGHDQVRQNRRALDQPTLKIGSNLNVSVRSPRAGFLYLFYQGSQPDSFYLLFPNQLDSVNAISANQELNLPRSDWSVTALGPRGTDHLLVMVTETARDFSALALPAEYVSQAGPFEKIQRTPQAVARIGQIATLSAATSKPACQNGASRDLGVARKCSNVFGASLVSVEEID